MQARNTSKWTYFLAVILVFIFLIWAIIHASFDHAIYEAGFEKYGIDKVSGFSKKEYLEEIEKYKSFLFNNSHDQSLLGYYYDDNELEHMKDVWELFKFARMLRNFLIVVMVLFFALSIKNKYSLDFSKGWYIFLLLPLTVALPAYLDFGKFWISFHKLVFQNDLWLMDPDTSLMIRLLPEGIFFDIVKSIILRYLIYSFTFIALQKGFILLKRRKNGIK